LHYQFGLAHRLGYIEGSESETCELKLIESEKYLVH